MRERERQRDGQTNRPTENLQNVLQIPLLFIKTIRYMYCFKFPDTYIKSSAFFTKA